MEVAEYVSQEWYIHEKVQKLKHGILDWTFIHFINCKWNSIRFAWSIIGNGPSC